MRFDARLMRGINSIRDCQYCTRIIPITHITSYNTEVIGGLDTTDTSYEFILLEILRNICWTIT